MNDINKILEEYYQLICRDRKYFKTYIFPEKRFVKPGLKEMTELFMEWRKVNSIEELKELVKKVGLEELLRIEDYYLDKLVETAEETINLRKENEKDFEKYFSKDNLKKLLDNDAINEQLKECINIYIDASKVCEKVYYFIENHKIKEYKGKMNELFEDNYQKKKGSNEEKITNLVEYAQVLIKCKIIDHRTKDYNIEGYDYEELLYDELMELKHWFCAEFLFLVEYSLYFDQWVKNPTMVKIIYEALKFAIDMFKETKEQRRNCRYNQLIDKIKYYENDFYGDILNNKTELEKRDYIKESIINNPGEILYYIQYYKLTHRENNKKTEDYWEIVMMLVNILDKRGKQREFKANERMNERIAKKNEIYEQRKKHQERIKEKNYNKTKN